MKSIQENTSKKILIVGAGITGLGLADLLVNHDVDVTIVEKLEKHEPKGSGLTMMPTGMKVMARLGLSKKLQELGTTSYMMKVTSLKGKLLTQIRLNEMGVEAVSLARSDLHEVLLSKMTNALVRFNTSVKDLQQTKHGVDVTFTDGSTSSFDLVIGADGINSVVRNLVFPKNAPKKSGAAMWTFLLPKTITLQDQNSVQQIWGDQRFMGIFPIQDGGTVTFVKPLDPNIRPSHVNLIEAFGDMSPQAAEILKSVNPKTIATTHLREIKLKHWYKNRVIIAGDAAHAMIPITGLGASMGLQDAEVIADLITSTPRNNLAKVGRLYEKKRKSLTYRHQREAYLLGRVIFLRNVAEKIRNILIPFVLNDRSAKMLQRVP